MHFVDTHTHLFSPSFDEDRTEIVQRAIKAGVKTMLLPNIDVESIEPMYNLCTQFPQNCFPMMGLHPGSVDEKWEENLAIIQKNLFERKNCAVGEIGMDLYWDKTFVNEQAEAFRRQVNWAKELNLPIVIHAREAFDEIFAIVDELNDERLTGVFHCFTGTLEPDSPYLPPTPHRGKRNESAYLLHVAEKLADVKGISLAEVAKITSKNANELFKLS